ncbi:MAG TPA: N-acetyltransferase, partial [Roseiarcus sp.]|nr:N-acetyltransferase [Roseiarcus sp.]
MTELSLVLEPETPADGEAILRLNERVFGPGRFARTAYRLRETTAADLSLSFVARVGTLLVGANAMTPIFIGATPALLLGPLIVEPVFRSQGIGEALVTRSLEAAREAGAKLTILVGDE